MEKKRSQAGPALISRLEAISEFLQHIPMHQVDRATPKPGAGHPRPDAPLDPARLFKEGIQLRAGHLVIPLQGEMGFPHQPSEGVQIPRRQRFRRAQHPVVFRHHVPDPAANPFRGDRLLQPFPIFGIHIGQGLEFGVLPLQLPQAGFTLLPALIVFRPGQSPGLVGMNDDQAKIPKPEGNVSVVEAVAMKQDGVIPFPHPGGERIHDSALDADEVVLRLLGQTDQTEHRPGNTVHRSQSRRRGQLDGGGRGKARPQGNIPVKQHVAAGERNALSEKLVDHPLGEVGPAVFLPVDHIAPFQLHPVRKLKGGQAEPTVLPEADRHQRAEGEGRGKNMTSVVVSMFPDEIHPARSEKYPFRRGAIQANKLPLQGFDALHRITRLPSRKKA